MKRISSRLLSVALLIVAALVTAAQTGRPVDWYSQAPSPDAVCTPIPFGMVSWWPGDGNPNDLRGGNNGTLFNTTFVPAEVDQGFNFASATGTQSGVSIGNPVNLQLNANLTIDFWIKRADTTRVSNYQNGTSGACFYCYGAGGYAVGMFTDGTVAFGKQDGSNVSSPGLKVTDTNFHHLAVTKAGGTVTLYLDGVAANVGPFDPGFVFNTNVAIGSRGDDGTAGFLGALDEIQIFNRALSSAEIQSIFGAGAAGVCKPTTGAIIKLAQSSYATGEGIADATITVNRTGDTTTSSTIDYATSDTAGANNCNATNGVASSRCDYLTTLGTLHFAAGEASKTISIPIVDDAYAEGAETFNLTLSNPTNATLGSPAATVITINDNDTSTGINPIDQANVFVRQHYIDFLNREPDQSGLDFWTNQITSCGSDAACIEVKRINVSAAFFLSIEFKETGFLVERIYKASYGDASGTSTFQGTHQLPVPVVRFNEFLSDTQEIGQGVIVGQGNWQQQLEDNKNAFSAEFVQRSRFNAAFPASMTPAQFVDALNANAGNPLSAAERNQLVTDLTNGAKTRAQVLRAVAEDADLANAETNRAFVLMQYLGYLRRNPNDPQDSDYTGYDFWLTKLNQSGGNFINAEMVRSFISSTEYRARFGP